MKLFATDLDGTLLNRDSQISRKMLLPFTGPSKKD